MNKKLKIKSVYIENFRSITLVENLSLEGDLIPIVGLNGAGKSNILKAINWFSKDSLDYLDKDGKLTNIYSKKNTGQTKVGLSFELEGEKPWCSHNKVILKNALNSFVEKFIERAKNLVENIEDAEKQLSNFVNKLLNKEQFNIFKVLNEGGNSQYIFDIDLPLLGVETPNDKDVILKTYSDLIKSNIVTACIPSIYLLDTKETLKEFDTKTANDENTEIGFSFKRLFDWTEFSSKADDKYKVISKILERTKTGYSFEEFMRISNSTNKGNVSLMNSGTGENLIKLQTEFSKAITSNGFFRSINSDNDFTIYPEYQSVKLMSESKIDDAYRLVLFDTVDYGDEKKYFPVDDLSFKNDGFIFALILFMEIDFLIEEESVLLIDEPANFLSTPSIKLLMENFKRISTEKSIQFVFTTHSSYTLDKNLVRVEDIVIAKKTKEFSTKVFSYKDKEKTKYESEIIAAEYQGPIKGRDLIMFEEHSEKRMNYLIKAKNQLEKDFIEFLNEFTEKNLIPLYSVKLVENNNMKYYPKEKSFKLKHIKKTTSKNLLTIISDRDIKRIIGKHELTPHGAVNEFKLEEDSEYRIGLIEMIFAKYNRDFKSLKNDLTDSIENIESKIDSLLK